MKNRKRIIVSFMIVACMLMAVGFAALTDILAITGDAEVNYAQADDAFDADIYFSAAVADNTAGGDSANVTSDVDVARFSVRSLASKNDTATFQFTVKNDNEFKAYAKVNNEKGVNNNTEYFNVTLDHTEFEVEAGGTFTFTVTVTLLKTPQLDESGDKISALFGIEFDAQDEPFNA